MLEQYLNGENIKASSRPLDAVQLTADDKEIIKTELIEINKFDDPALDEVIELHIYNTQGSYLTSDHTAEHWKHFSTDESFLQFDVYKNFQDNGISQGTFKFVLNFHRNLVGDDNNPNLFIKEISPDKTEILIKVGQEEVTVSQKETKNLDVPEVTTYDQLNMFHERRMELCGDNGYVNFLFLNFGANETYQFVNYRWLANTKELYIKLYQPLPDDVKEKRKFWIVQQVRQPYSDNTVLYRKPVEAPVNNLKGPNWEIDVKYGKISETNFQNWNDLLGSSTATSQQIIDKLFSGSLSGAHLGIDYSGFQNFVNYSSAKERLANFKYKVELIEYYDSQIGTLNNISESNEINANKSLYRRYKDNIVGGFDGFEQYMYREQTGSFYTHGISGSAIHQEGFTVQPWPKEAYGKTISGKIFTKNEYTLHHSTSSAVEGWYDGLLASASLWDTGNESALIKAVPEHIREDSNNSEFETFVNMIGHHYDIMWSYIKHQTDIYNRDEHYAHGLSKDLLYDVAKSFGWHLINGNQQERLFEYLLGTDEKGNHGKINERIIDRNLQLYIPFDEGRPDFASKNLIDYSINNNPLKDYVKPSFVPGKHGHGAKFNGTQYLQYNNNIDLGTNDFAVSFWAKDIDGNTSGTNGDILSHMSGSIGDKTGIQITSNKSSQTLDFNVWWPGPGGTSAGNPGGYHAVSASLNQFTASGDHEGTTQGWQHFVLNGDRSGQMRLYRNAVSIQGVDISVSSSADLGQNTQDGNVLDYVEIGGHIATATSSNMTNGFKGEVDEIRLYNRILLPNEIEDLYHDVGLYVSQSTAVPTTVPKEALTHQVWRRIVNNLPHLLKTKGTSRSVKALLSCYGIPESLLSIREYGGPKMPKTQPAGIYEQFSYALEFTSGSAIVWPDDYYNTDIGSWGFKRPFIAKGTDIPVQTREWRFKPAITQSMLLMSTAYEVSNQQRLQNHVAIEYTGSYSGSADYGRVHLVTGRGAASTTPMTASSDWVPLYDGNFWNIRWYYVATGSDSGIYNNAVNLNTTYHVQVQQASDYVVGKIVHSASLSITPTYSDHKSAWANPASNRRVYLGGNSGSSANGDSYKVNTYLHRILHGNGSAIGSANTDPGCGTFSGSMQEYRDWLEDIGQDAFDKHTLNPKSYVSNISPSSSYDTLVRHYPLGTNQKSYRHDKALFITSSHPAQSVLDFSDPSGSNKGDTFATASGWSAPGDRVNKDHYARIDETYYVHGPSIGGKNLKSEKIRIESNKLVHPLSRETRGEVSAYDVASNDSNRLGIFFSPQDMINKDIFNQIGGASLDDYFGSAEYQFTDNYPRFKMFAQDYWKKYENDNDLNAYIRVFALFDFSFFTQLKQLIPIRTNADTGLIVEPSILERSKVVIETRPRIEKLMYGDFIPYPNPDLTSSLLPLEKDIDAHYPVTGTLLPLEQSIHEIQELSGSYLDLKQTIGVHYPITSSHLTHNSMIDMGYTASAEYLGYTSSVDGITKNVQAEQVIIQQMITSSTYGRDVTDPGLDLFKIQTGFPGAVYRHIGLTLSGSTWITSSRHELEYSPTGSIITEQRKDPYYKKKVFSYAPKPTDVRHYPLGKREANGKFLDLTPGVYHSISHSSVHSSTQAITAVATPKFETVTHNRFTGTILTVSASQSASIWKRGREYVEIPNIELGGSLGYKKQWSVAWLMKDALGPNTQSVFMGADNNTNEDANFDNLVFPRFEIDTSEKLRVIPQSNAAQLRWESPTAVTNQTDLNHFVITYDGRDSANAVMEFWQNGKSMGTESRAIGQNPTYSASFAIEAIGSGYQSTANGTTYGFSGSIGQVRIWDRKLTTQDINYLNKYPHLRVERDIDVRQRRGREHMTRRLRSNGYAPFTDIGTFATSHSLVAADYRQDKADNSYYIGSKLTAPNINEFSDQTVDGEEVVKITVRNRYNLVYKKDLPGGANLDVR